MKTWSVVVKEGHPFGLLAGVSMPAELAPVPAEVLDRLHPAERAYAEGLRGFHQVQWVGGRLAAAVAVRMLGRRPEPVMADDRGGPCCAGGVTLSITHKRNLAMALAARPELGCIGVDLEDLHPPRLLVAPRVLTAAELRTVEALPQEYQWTAVVTRFAVKEAIYKALAPRLRRYIGFEEAEVTPDPSGAAEVRLHLAEAVEDVKIEARYSWLDGRVLAAVRARWP